MVELIPVITKLCKTISRKTYSYRKNLIQFVPKSVDLNTVELFIAETNSLDTIICRPYCELILDLNM